MDFFQAQDSARRNTTSLVFFFTLAVLSLIVFTNLLVMVLFGFLDTQNQPVTLSVDRGPVRLGDVLSLLAPVSHL